MATKRGRPKTGLIASKVKWIRMTPETEIAIRQIASEERRSQTMMIQILIEEALKARAGVEARKP